jgi:2-phosphosulfolactate phosphatase
MEDIGTIVVEDADENGSRWPWRSAHFGVLAYGGDGATSGAGTSCAHDERSSALSRFQASHCEEAVLSHSQEGIADPPDARCVEVCFSPGLFQDVLTTGDFIVVLVDILRATTTICTAVANGVEAIIPVASHEEARQLKSEGFLVASEKDGVQVDFADFGNSAFSFTREAIGGKTLVYCTTNGTRALQMAKSASSIAIGAFINISALTEWLAGQQKNVVILCSGWKNKFCLEDTLFAGALTGRLLETCLFQTECDSANASMDLWHLAEGDVLAYVEKAAQRHRLKKLGLDDVIPYSFACDRVNVVPLFDGKQIKGYVAHPPTA